MSGSMAHDHADAMFRMQRRCLIIYECIVVVAIKFVVNSPLLTVTIIVKLLALDPSTDKHGSPHIYIFVYFLNFLFFVFSL